MADAKILVINAVVDVDGPDKTMWVAQVVADGSPFAGLFAWGDNFAGARAGLAQVVWAAVAGGAEGLAAAGVAAADIAAVRVLATTRKTFSATELAETT